MNYYQKQMADFEVSKIIDMSDEETLKEVKDKYGDENYLANKMRGIIAKAKENVKNELQ